MFSFFEIILLIIDVTQGCPSLLSAPHRAITFCRGEYLGVQIYEYFLRTENDAI
jgi:hypothetical protein